MSLYLILFLPTARYYMRLRGLNCSIHGLKKRFCKYNDKNAILKMVFWRLLHNPRGCCFLSFQYSLGYNFKIQFFSFFKKGKIMATWSPCRVYEWTWPSVLEAGFYTTSLSSCTEYWCTISFSQSVLISRGESILTVMFGKFNMNPGRQYEK